MYVALAVGSSALLLYTLRRVFVQGPSAPRVSLEGKTVVVTGARREAELGTVPAAVTVVPQEVIQNMQRGTNLEESLRRVPGALLRDQLGGSSRVTISVRGAGATAMPHGPSPTAIVARTRPVAVSITDTSFDAPFAV